MQGIAGILGGKGGGAGSGAPAGAAAKPPGGRGAARQGRSRREGLPAGVGGGRVHGGGLCVELVCAWGAAPAAQPRRRSRRGGRRPPSRPEGGGLRPGGGVGWCRWESTGSRRARRAAPAEGRGVGGGRRPPPKAARRAACPAGRGAGYAGAGRESVPCTGRQAARALQKTLHNFTKLSPVFTEDKKLCQVLFTICGYNGCQ